MRGRRDGLVFVGCRRRHDFEWTRCPLRVLLPVAFETSGCVNRKRTPLDIEDQTQQL